MALAIVPRFATAKDGLAKVEADATKYETLVMDGEADVPWE